MTREQILRLLKSEWDRCKTRIDWAGYERLIHEIYHSQLGIEDRCLATMEALDAFTRRGHFDLKNYLSAKYDCMPNTVYMRYRWGATE